MRKGIGIGVLLTLFAGFIGAYLFIFLGLMPANADGKPGSLETWMARKSLHATIQREAPAIPNPQALNGVNLVSGIKLYAVNCAVCHGAADGAESNIAKGLYQTPPQLAKDGVEDDPEGVTYWKIKHGIRLTGMPAFTGTLNEQQIWRVTLFLKHMDSLPAAPKKIWKAIPSAASRN